MPFPWEENGQTDALGHMPDRGLTPFIWLHESIVDGPFDVNILDVATKKLACYTRDHIGILYLGSRLIEFDLLPDEVNPNGQRIAVRDMKKKSSK